MLIPKIYNLLFKIKLELFRFSEKSKIGKFFFDLLYEDFIPKKKVDFKYELVIVSILKNEGLYIKEWLEYHKLVGVEKFYLYDNGSTDNVLDILKPYIESGFIKYHKFDGKKMQLVAYEHAIKNYKNEAKWFAVIDLDEFIFPVVSNNVVNVFKDYENECGLKICCVDYDTNGHMTRPEGLVTENYTTRKANLTAICKSISNPRKIKFCVSAHSAIYKKNELAVGEKFNHCDGDRNPDPSIEKIRINHYFCKSFEEYKIKCNRPMADNGGSYEQPQEPLIFEDAIADNSMEKFLPELKRRLNCT